MDTPNNATYPLLCSLKYSSGSDSSYTYCDMSVLCWDKSNHVGRIYLPQLHVVCPTWQDVEEELHAKLGNGVVPQYCVPELPSDSQNHVLFHLSQQEALQLAEQQWERDRGHFVQNFNSALVNYVRLTMKGIKDLRSAPSRRVQLPVAAPASPPPVVPSALCPCPSIPQQPDTVDTVDTVDVMEIDDVQPVARQCPPASKRNKQAKQSLLPPPQPYQGPLPLEDTAEPCTSVEEPARRVVDLLDGLDPEFRLEACNSVAHYSLTVEQLRKLAVDQVFGMTVVGRSVRIPPPSSARPANAFQPSFRYPPPPAPEKRAPTELMTLPDEDRGLDPCEKEGERLTDSLKMASSICQVRDTAVMAEWRALTTHQDKVHFIEQMYRALIRTHRLPKDLVTAWLSYPWVLCGLVDEQQCRQKAEKQWRELHPDTACADSEEEFQKLLARVCGAEQEQQRENNPWRPELRRITHFQRTGKGTSFKFFCEFELQLDDLPPKTVRDVEVPSFILTRIPPFFRYLKHEQRWYLKLEAHLNLEDKDGETVQEDEPWDGITFLKKRMTPTLQRFQEIKRRMKELNKQHIIDCLEKEESLLYAKDDSSKRGKK